MLTLHVSLTILDKCLKLKHLQAPKYCCDCVFRNSHMFVSYSVIDTSQLNRVNNSTNATELIGNLQHEENVAHKHTLVYIGGSCVFVLILIIIIIAVIVKMRRSSMHMLKYTNVKRVIVMRPVRVRF